MKFLAIVAAGLLLVPRTIAIEAPPMREGLWSIHTQTVSNPGNKKDEGTRSLCRNHAYDDRVRSSAKKSTCKTISESLSGTTFVTENECSVAGSMLRTQAKSTKTGEDVVRSEIHTTYTPPVYGMAETTMIMDQKYVGACPAGVEPGDMINPDGKVIHRGR